MFRAVLDVGVERLVVVLWGRAGNKKKCLAVFHGWQNVFTQLNDVRHTQGNATNDENGTVEEEVDDEQVCCWSKRERERGEINDRFERGNSTCRKEK